MATLGNQISPLQVSYTTSWSGLTTENHFSAIYQTNPQLASNIMTRLFALNNEMGLDALLNKYPAKEMPTDDDYEWYIKGDDRKPVNIVTYSATDSTRPGVGNTTFRLTLEEKFYEQSDVLIFDDRNFMVRIMSEPWSDGVNWIYEVQIHPSNDPTLFIPTYLLQAGKQVSKQWSSVTTTLNKEYGGVSHTAPFKMRNIFSSMGKHYTVPGNMQQRQLIMTVTDSKTGNKTNMWIRELEAVANYQWAMEKANNLIYSRYNKNANGTFTMKGSNSFPIKEGAGLREQISPSYKFYYNTFSIDYLLEVLTNISINTLPEDQREFVLLTGERGMIQVHKAIEAKVAMFQPFGNPARLTGAGQNLGFQGQYRSYIGPQGVKITVMNMPSYNDPVDNRFPHPDGGWTENYRYTIMNIGTTNGEANIQRVYPKGRRDLMWYVPGSTTPFGPNTSMSSMGASAVDGYEVYFYTTQGIMLKNPLSCAELIYAGSRTF